MEIGKNYAVSFGDGMWLGTCVDLEAFRAKLSPCVFVASTGRRHIFFRDGKADGMEIEAETAQWFPVHLCRINDWPHKIPETQ